MMNRIRRILSAVMAAAIIITGIPFSFAEEGQMIELTPEQIAELTAAPEEVSFEEPKPAEEAVLEQTKITEESVPDSTVEITVESTVEETPEDTIEVTVEPTTEPVAEPMEEVEVTPEPHLAEEPTVEPALEHTPEVNVDPSFEPSTEPSTEPAVDPTTEPTEELLPQNAQELATCFGFELWEIAEAFEMTEEELLALPVKKITDLYARIQEMLGEASVMTASDFVIENGVLTKYNGTDEHVIIPNGIKKIGDYVFKNKKIRSVEISSSVTEIGVLAFSNTKLSHITIPANIKIIRSAAFRDCTLLNSIEILNGLELLEGGWYGSGVFENCTGLKSVVIKSTKLKEIGGRSFANCPYLSKFEIADGVLETIGYNAFGGCSRLEEIYLPDTLKSIGEQAFWDCKNTTIWVFRDSVAYNYCQQNAAKEGFTYKIRSSEPLAPTPYLSWTDPEYGLDNGLYSSATGEKGSTIGITSNVSWKVTGPSWVRFEPSSGSGNGSFTVYVNANTGAAREGYIAVSASGCATLQMKITQEAGKAKKFSFEEDYVTNGIQVKPGETWSWIYIQDRGVIASSKIISGSSWLEAEDWDWMIELYMPKNTTGKDRYATIEISAPGYETAQIQITQYGKCSHEEAEAFYVDKNGDYIYGPEDADCKQVDKYSHSYQVYVSKHIVLCWNCDETLASTTINKNMTITEPHYFNEGGDGKGGCYYCHFKASMGCKHPSYTQSVNKYEYFNEQKHIHVSYQLITDENFRYIICNDCGTYGEIFDGETYWGCSDWDYEANSYKSIFEDHVYTNGKCPCGYEKKVIYPSVSNFKLSAAEVTVGESISLSGTVSGNGVKLDIITVNVRDAATEKTGGTHWTQSGINSTSYSLSNIPKLVAGEKIGSSNTVLSPGRYVIEVYAKNVDGTILSSRQMLYFTVKEKPVVYPTVNGFKLSTAEVTVGESISLSGTVSGNGVKLKSVSVSVTKESNGKVCWLAGNTNVNAASYDLKKVAKMIAGEKIGVSSEIMTPGKYTIEVHAENVEGTKFSSAQRLTLTVKEAGKLVLSGETTITAGKSAAYIVKKDGKTIANKNLTWETSNKNIATVSGGKVTAKKAGVATITATAKDKSTGSITVTVLPKATDVTIYHGNEAMGKNTAITIDLNAADKTYALRAVVAPDSAMQDVTWKSSSTKIAQVDANGVVTALKAGTATITATTTDGSRKSAKVKINVVCKVQEIMITGVTELTAGKSTTLKATISPANVTNKKLIWTTSDKNIATVSSSGKVTAKKVSRSKTVTITATAQDGSGVAAVHHFTILPLAEEIYVQMWREYGEYIDKEIELNLNYCDGEIPLFVTSYPFAASNEVIWSVQHKGIATVSTDGVLRGLKEGKTKITVKTKDGSNLQKSFTVNVVDGEETYFRLLDKNEKIVNYLKSAPEQNFTRLYLDSNTIYEGVTHPEWVETGMGAVENGIDIWFFENTSSEARIGSIIFEVKDYGSYEIQIEQDGKQDEKSYLHLAEKIIAPLTAYSRGGQGSPIGVESNVVWSASSNVDWIHPRADVENGLLSASYDANNGVERRGSIFLTADGCDTVEIQVVQLAMEVGEAEIFSVHFSCNAQEAKVGETFTLTVVTNDQTKKLRAVNNSGTGFKNPDAWTTSQNADGTITWTRSYIAEDAIATRYWIVTPYNANDVAGTAVDSNKIDITAPEYRVWYMLNEKRDEGKFVTDGTIQLTSENIGDRISIYLSNENGSQMWHPSSNNRFYYEVKGDEGVLSLLPHAYQGDVLRNGEVTVSIWDLEKNIIAKSVNIVVKEKQTSESLTYLTANMTGFEKVPTDTIFINTETKDSYLTLLLISEDNNGVKTYLDIGSSTYSTDGYWLEIIPSSTKDVKHWFNGTVIKFVSFKDASYKMKLWHKDNKGNQITLQEFEVKIRPSHKLLSKHRYCLQYNIPSNCTIATPASDGGIILYPAWGKDIHPTVSVVDQLTDETLTWDNSRFELFVNNSLSDGSIHGDYKKTQELIHKDWGYVLLGLKVDGEEQGTLPVYCVHEEDSRALKEALENPLTFVTWFITRNPADSPYIAWLNISGTGQYGGMLDSNVVNWIAYVEYENGAKEIHNLDGLGTSSICLAYWRGDAKVTLMAVSKYAVDSYCIIDSKYCETFAMQYYREHNMGMIDLEYEQYYENLWSNPAIDSLTWNEKQAMNVRTAFNPITTDILNLAEGMVNYVKIGDYSIGTVFDLFKDLKDFAKNSIYDIPVALIGASFGITGEDNTIRGAIDLTKFLFEMAKNPSIEKLVKDGIVGDGLPINLPFSLDKGTLYIVDENGTKLLAAESFIAPETIDGLITLYKEHQKMNGYINNTIDISLKLTGFGEFE